jgi:hypothetical protein
MVHPGGIAARSDNSSSRFEQGRLYCGGADASVNSPQGHPRSDQALASGQMSSSPTAMRSAVVVEGALVVAEVTMRIPSIKGAVLASHLATERIVVLTAS